jgi:diadenosine tetraphosphate (Ap4A) HIT family hydrolase
VVLVHATGTAAWQSGFHFHVVPRYRSDELQVMWWHETPAPDEELAALRLRLLAQNQ